MAELGIRAAAVDDAQAAAGIAKFRADKQKDADSKEKKSAARADGKEAKVDKKDAKQPAVRKPPLSLIVDTTTDVAMIEQLLIYARSVRNGEPITKFLGIVPVSNGKSDTMTAAILDFVADIGYDIRQLAGFGSDGAKSMIGSKNGVATQLARVSAFLLSIHCAGHRGNLAGM